MTFAEMLRLEGLPVRAAYRVAEVCRVLRMSRTKLYELCESGELKHYRVGRELRIPLCEVEAFMSR